MQKIKAKNKHAKRFKNNITLVFEQLAHSRPVGKNKVVPCKEVCSLLAQVQCQAHIPMQKKERAIAARANPTFERLEIQLSKAHWILERLSSDCQEYRITAQQPLFLMPPTLSMAKSMAQDLFGEAIKEGSDKAKVLCKDEVVVLCSILLALEAFYRCNNNEYVVRSEHAAACMEPRMLFRHLTSNYSGDSYKQTLPLRCGKTGNPLARSTVYTLRTGMDTSWLDNLPLQTANDLVNTLSFFLAGCVEDGRSGFCVSVMRMQAPKCVLRFAAASSLHSL